MEFTVNDLRDLAATLESFISQAKGPPLIEFPINNEELIEQLNQIIEMLEQLSDISSYINIIIKSLHCYKSKCRIAMSPTRASIQEIINTIHSSVDDEYD